MKVLYDYQAFTMQKYGGVSRGICEIISRLPLDIQYEIGLEESDNVNLREYGVKPDVKECKYPYSAFFPKLKFRGKHRIYNLLESIGLFSSPEKLGKEATLRALEKGDVDVFHPTFFDTYFLPYLKGIPFVLTVHDLTFEVLKEKYHFKDSSQITPRKIMCPLAAHITVPSQNTANDLMKYYNVPENKITVIHWGASNINKRNSLKKIIDGRYILFTGERDRYKNWNLMIEQIAPIVKLYDLKIVCTGRPFTKYEIKQLNSLRIYDKTINMFVSTEELSSLYNNAELFVYPSEYEGFGIPILEAFANGCPTLLSRSSCFPEVGGDAAMYFELGKDNALREAVNRMVNDSEMQNELVSRGYLRNKAFSWEKAAMQYAEVYKSLI